MAIDYSLLLSRKDPPELWVTELVTASVISIRERSQTLYKDYYGIQFQFGVVIRLNTHRLSESENELVDVVGKLLRADSDDALLLFNGELPALRRCDGLVTLSKRSGIWTPTRQAMLGLPVRVEDLGPVL